MDKFVVKSQRHDDHKSSSSNVQQVPDYEQSSDEEISSSSSEQDTTKKRTKKINFVRKYSQDWKREFKWVKLDLETKKPICVVCKQLLNCQKSHLERHSKTSKHKDHFKNAQESNTMQLENFLPKRSTNFRKNVAIAEIKLVLRMISCNQSFNSMDKLAKFNSKIYPDSAVAKSVTCCRTKSKTIAQFLGKESFLLMIQSMKSQNFSLIIDETTDVSTEKCLVIVVRQFDTNKGKTVDKFFRLLKPNSGSGDTIANTIIAVLEDNQIPFKNFIGFATDNASSMVGKHNGVATLLKRKIPHLFHIGCVCHSINLINCSSLICIPKDVEQLLRNIFKYFKSAKRQNDFKELQNIFDVPEHKLLRLSDTRWLSFQSVASRTLEQWSVLQHFFIRAQFEEKCASNMDKIRNIQEGLSVTNKIYLKFLVYILEIMNKLNVNFQSESSQIIYLISSTKEILLAIFKNFLKKEYVMETKIENIDFNNISNVKDTLNIYIGHEAEVQICGEKIPNSAVIEIKTNILNFYRKLCYEITSRIDIKDKRLTVLRFLDPVFIKSNEDLNYFEIISEFSNIISEPEAFINEFKLLESKAKDKTYEPIFKISNAETFWFEIGKIKNRLNRNLYSNLYKFVAYVFTLPHSSASAERVFSKLALLKNKLSNRLNVDTCESMLSSLNLFEAELEDWTPSNDLITKYRTVISKN